MRICKTCNKPVTNKKWRQFHRKNNHKEEIRLVTKSISYQEQKQQHHLM